MMEGGKTTPAEYLADSSTRLDEICRITDLQDLALSFSVRRRRRTTSTAAFLLDVDFDLFLASPSFVFFSKFSSSSCVLLLGIYSLSSIFDTCFLVHNLFLPALVLSSFPVGGLAHKKKQKPLQGLSRLTRFIWRLEIWGLLRRTGLSAFQPATANPASICHSILSFGLPSFSSHTDFPVSACSLPVSPLLLSLLHLGQGSSRRRIFDGPKDTGRPSTDHKHRPRYQIPSRGHKADRAKAEARLAETF